MTTRTLTPKLQSAPATDSRIIGAVIVARPKLKPQSALTPAPTASAPMLSKRPVELVKSVVLTPVPAATIVPPTKSAPVKSPSALPTEHYCDLSDITQLVTSKPEMFWCYTHLLDMPREVQSIDPRYCRECHEILKDEYQDMVFSPATQSGLLLSVKTTVI